jgi:hypothetical protein
VWAAVTFRDVPTVDFLVHQNFPSQFPHASGFPLPYRCAHLHPVHTTCPLTNLSPLSSQQSCSQRFYWYSPLSSCIHSGARWYWPGPRCVPYTRRWSSKNETTRSMSLMPSLPSTSHSTASPTPDGGFLAEDVESAKQLMQDCNANLTADELT